MNDLKVFSGYSNRPLAEKVAEKMGCDLGVLISRRFSDGEIWVKYGENIRGLEVFLIQSTNSPADNLMELLMMIDAAKRASAKKITAVIPYYGYSRQDRKDQPRVSITAKLVANLIQTAGADRVITMDLHASQIQGFFDIPTDHLYGSSVFINRLISLNDNLAIVSPDVGGIKIARAYAKSLGASLVVIDKRRPQHNVAEIVNIIGNVEGKNVLLVDDLIDTGGTMVNAVNALRSYGAQRIFIAATHGVLSGNASKELNDSQVEKVFVTDTISIPENKQFEKLEVLSASSIFAEAITRTYNNESISSLFFNEKS